MTAAISDYGKLYASWDPHTVCRPQNATEVSQLVAESFAVGRAIRVRGSAHTFSGATIPRTNELLIRTDRLDRFSFDRLGTVTVGAGAIAWDVRDLAASYGLVMPVYNGGWAGPTIGGYVAAGGMGLRVPPRDRERSSMISISEVHGGFWEHVAALTIADGTGALHHMTETDEMFQWVFGSFGQLGIVVDVQLKLLTDTVGTKYPLGATGHVPHLQVDDPAVNDLLPSPTGNRILFWFSFLVSLDQEAPAWAELGRWVERHAPFLAPEGGWVGPTIAGQPIGYRYVVRHKRFHPPLLYPRGEDFVLMGLMTTFDGVGTLATDDRILALERDFIGIADRCGYRLYPQAENIGRGIDYTAYYGRETYSAFAAFKQRMDPAGILNPGVVFPSAVAAPQRSAVARLAESTFARLGLTS